MVSVVIPTRNSATHLEECLSAITGQSYPSIEIIVVDNNSVDRTKEIAAVYTDRVYNKTPERCAQLNFGIAVANGKYVYYTGSDLRSDSDLVEQAVTKCEEEGYDAIYMNVVTDIPRPNIWQRVRALERRCYYKEPGISAARFYKREVFLDLGGMDESLSGVSDDLEFQHRLDACGYRTAFINADEHNLGEYDSLRIIITRSLYYGSRIKRYMDKYPQKTKKQYRLVREEFVRHRDILLEDKALFAAFVCYKVIQYACAGAGVLLARWFGNEGGLQRFLFHLNYGKDGVC